MKNKGLIFGGIAAVAVIGLGMWYNKNKKAGTLPKWLSADGEWNNAGGDCYKNNKGSFDCIGKDGFVRTGSTLKEAKDLATSIGIPVPAQAYKDYKKVVSGSRMS